MKLIKRASKQPEITVHEAKTHFSKILALVQNGEEIVICRGNEPVAKVIPYSRFKRKFGALKGSFNMAEDFNDFLDPLSFD